MDLELKIENFGPIDEATIQVGQFTVFTGPNNTGKTFVAKMLYSMLGAMNANHALVVLDQMASIIELDLQTFEQSGQAVEERPLSAIRRGLQKIDSILREELPRHSIQNELDKLRAVQPELIAEIEKIKVHFRTLKNNSHVHPHVGDLERYFRDIEGMITFGLYLKFRRNVYRNFQASDLSNFKGCSDSPLYFSVQGVGELRITKDQLFEFYHDQQIVQKMQSFPKTFYLESPLYWKLRNALESIKLGSSFWDSLNGIPEYFYDMAVALRRRRIEHPFAGIHEGLHNAIGGQISLNEAGDLEFHEKGKSVALSLTSAGVVNMGMLALLIERGALERGSFLFIDEPESNLHPAWQVEMAEILFELARQGVNVVISTHSMTILKWLEVHVKEKPEDRELVRMNKFPPDAEWNDDMDAVMAEVKQSLTKPFSDLYIKGL